MKGFRNVRKGKGVSEKERKEFLKGRVFSKEAKYTINFQTNTASVTY